MRCAHHYCLLNPLHLNVFLTKLIRTNTNQQESDLIRAFPIPHKNISKFYFIYMQNKLLYPHRYIKTKKYNVLYCSKNN